MEKKDADYISLQRHLNRQVAGFPATKSKVEIDILKHIFTPFEAKIATCLSYQPQSLTNIFATAGRFVESPEKLGEILDHIADKGGIEIIETDHAKQYRNLPFVVGMYEFQVKTLTPEFIEKVNLYTSQLKFGIELLSTRLPQMRTIPISKSIDPRHNVSTFDEVATLLAQADAPFVILECICRKKKTMEGVPCRVTDRKETCLAIGTPARNALRNEMGREIDRDEAFSILEKNQKDGLVLQPSNTEKAEFICSCCGCCCGIISMHKRLPIPVEFWASNFYAVVAADRCNGCGNCEKRCQVGAIAVASGKEAAEVDLKRCIGCGLCIPVCPRNALRLQKKHSQVTPPKTREDLYDYIMSHKKGRLEKYRLAGKLIVDAIRTGQTHLLK